MESKRIVNFYFYNIFEVDEQLNKDLADFTTIFDELEESYKDMQKENDNREVSEKEEDQMDSLKTIAYRDEHIRLIKVQKNENGYYHLTFERLHHVIPNVSKILGASKKLDLEPDEYIGHQITVLYDPFKFTIMLQRNISSLSPNGVETFLNNLYIEKYNEDKHIELSLVIDKHKKKSIHHASEYRDIFVRVTKESSKDLFKRMWPHHRMINLDYLEFKIKAKKSINKNNDTEYIKEEIAHEIIESYKESSDVDKLLVKAKIDDSDKVTLVDVLNQKLQRQIEFTKNDRYELNTNKVYEQMERVYREDAVHKLPN